MNKTKQSTLYILLLFIMYACTAAALPLLQTYNYTAQVARAADSATYSDVLEDLSKDPMFNSEDYELNIGDPSLEVIQIAESSSKELFIYVYQPSGQLLNLRATSINISTGIGNSLSYKNYRLTYLNSTDVFFKYKVKDFAVGSADCRYYDISTILRPYNKNYDSAPVSGTVSEQPYKVAQQWSATTKGDTVTYNKTDTTVIEIQNKYVGYIDIFDGAELDGLQLTGSHTFINFVAFSTDFPMDKLIQVDLQFSLQDYTFDRCASLVCTKHKYKEDFNHQRGDKRVQKPITISADEKISNHKHGILGYSYTWNKIQRTEDFIADNDGKNYKLKSESKGNLSDTQWVLNFYDAPIVATSYGSIVKHLSWVGELVADVIILRLQFETAGTPYNVGVIDGKQTSANEPANEKVLSPIEKAADDFFSFFDDLFDGDSGLGWLWTVLIIIAAVIVGIPLIIVSVYLTFNLLKLLFMRTAARAPRRRAPRRKPRKKRKKPKAKPKK